MRIRARPFGTPEPVAAAPIRREDAASARQDRGMEIRRRRLSDDTGFRVRQVKVFAAAAKHMSALYKGTSA
jgi:hypothetical protein